MGHEVIDFDLILSSLPNLLHGAMLSVLIALFAAIIGIVLGTILAFAESSQRRVLRYFVVSYVTLLRGTPMLIQILFVFYVLPQFGLTIDSFWAASIAIGMNSSAYISQTVRAGVNAVPYGQIEAAYALGFSRLETMRYIVFPQAFRFSLPSLCNELITLVKDSSLASIIGVMELTKEASIIRSRTYDAFSILLVVALIYLIITATLSFCARKIEKKVKMHV